MIAGTDARQQPFVSKKLNQTSGIIACCRAVSIDLALFCCADRISVQALELQS